MANCIEIQPTDGPVSASIRPPGSKSLTNRALLVAAIAKGQSVLKGALESDDTRYMIESLQKVGVNIAVDSPSKTITVDGVAGKLPKDFADLFIGNSGTSIRFLTAMLGVHGGKYTLDGIERMRERPIGPLIDSLNQLGSNSKALSPNASPPVQIDSERLKGGKVAIKGDISSQYLSGLLMAASLARGSIEIEIEGPLISKPYVAMTIAVMKSFGVECKMSPNMDRFEIAAGQSYSACQYAIEPDASAASYFWAVAAICGGTATVTGLNRDALQGDVRFVECLERMGCSVEYAGDSIAVTGPATQGIDVDMAHISDTVQTLTAVALFVQGPTTIRNVAHNRVKETDRIGNLAIELRKFGVSVEEREDGLTIHPPGESGSLLGADIETYDDHRMAMSLALVGLKQPGVKIQDPGCVSKTYPNFFEDLGRFVGSN